MNISSKLPSKNNKSSDSPQSSSAENLFIVESLRLFSDSLFHTY